MNRISDFGLKVARQNNRYATCHCPLHDDKHASALVYLDKMWFVCFVCNISRPLEAVLRDAGIDSSGVERIVSFEDIDLSSEAYRVQPLTLEAIHYLADRGVDAVDVPSYVKSPVHNKGVAFSFVKQNGEIIGSQVRLFPENVAGKSWRYLFEGKRLPYMGNIAPHYKEKRRLMLFEKAFATLKAEIAINTFGLPAAAVSTVGAHFQRELLPFVTIDSVVFFDNDAAGINAAREMKKMTGARVIISANPLDELTIEDMGRYLKKYL